MRRKKFFDTATRRGWGGTSCSIDTLRSVYASQKSSKQRRVLTRGELLSKLQGVTVLMSRSTIFTSWGQSGQEQNHGIGEVCETVNNKEEEIEKYGKTKRKIKICKGPRRETSFKKAQVP